MSVLDYFFIGVAAGYLACVITAARVLRDYTVVPRGKINDDKS